MNKGKRFKVFSNRGAHIRDIMGDLICVADENSICRQCVKSIFLVCGGNDTEGLHGERGVMDIISRYATLLDYTGFIFPSARVNIISLIPRRLRYYNHLRYMIIVNDNLSNLCNERDNCRFINVFSHYLRDKKSFFRYKHAMILNEKLYANDKLHFSNIGNSVLGKIIKGVTYNPRS